MTEGKGYRETCPKCNSDNIVGDDMDPIDVTFFMTCENCRAKWIQYYKPNGWVYEDESK